MYKRILVKELIDEGRQLLEALARNRFPIHAALWFYLPDSSEWRLIIVTPTVDRKGPLAAYTRVQSVLRSLTPSQLALSDISLMGPSDQDFQNVRAAISSPIGAGAASGRVTNVIFEDAYLYQW